MNLLYQIWRSSLGKKYLMAITGCGLVLFLFGHMVGNLQIFLGPEKLNAYAQLLHVSDELLWGVRLGMITMVVVHVASAITLALQNRAARPVQYASSDLVAATYASRTMVMSGVIVGFFVIYHLLHFTADVKAINMTGVDFSTLMERMKNGEERHDVYAMVITGFRNPIVSIFYIIALGLLCTHVRHGIQAFLQSLGLKNEAWRGRIDFVAIAGATVLFLGYTVVPLSVLLGLIGKGVK